MDPSIPLHPALVHFPLGIGLLMPVIALGVHLFIVVGRKDASMWWLPVALQVVVLFSGFVAMQTGEHEEERVERVVDEEHIENHEGAAKVFMLLSALSLVIMGAGLKTTSWQPFLRLGSVVVLMGAAVVGANTGKQGGELVYRHGAARAYFSSDNEMNANPAASSEYEEHEKNEHEGQEDD